MKSPFIFLLLIALSAYASDDEEFVFREIAKSHGISVEEVRDTYVNGCESGRTAKMRNCIYYHRLADDLYLDEYYHRLLKKYGETDAGNKFQKAQNAWLAYRDTNCMFESSAYVAPEKRDFADPKDSKELFVSCKSRLNVDRVKLLKKYIACPAMDC